MFNEIQIEIESLCEDLDEELNERVEFEAKFESAIGPATDILEKFNFNSGKFSDDNSVCSESSSKSCAGIKPSVVLPQIDLPKFNGAPEDWLEYRATYENLIHTNDALNDLQKFHYLKASLGGIAAQLVKPTPFVAENYSIAWNALCDEYDNSKVLIHEHVRALFHLNCIQREDASELKKLINQVSQHLTCLEMLGEGRQNLGNLLLTHLIKTKLDTSTAQEWEKCVNKISKRKKVELEAGAQASSVSWEEMKDFLKERASLLKTTEVDYNTENKDRFNKFKDRKRISKSFLGNTGDSVVALEKTAFSCNYCKQDHSIYNCKAFAKLKPQDRVEFVRKSNLCKVCLLGGHASRNCKHGPCRKCKKFHNSLLHEAFNTPKRVEQDSVNKEGESDASLSSNLTSLSVSGAQVLLSTASVLIKGNDGKIVKARVLLDSGSQASFVTSNLCEKLGVEKIKSKLSIFGINNVKALSEHECNIEIKSRTGNFVAKLNCYILPEITSYTPCFPISITDLKIPSELGLADPEFHIPGPVDVLIGGELFWDLIRNGKVSLGVNKPILKETALGWVIAGQVECRRSRQVRANVCINAELSSQIQRFWEIEEFSNTMPLSEEEEYCEKHFKENTQRDASGKFIVSMPLKQSPEVLGESYNQALQRLLSVERKFKRNAELRKYYCEFMRDYESMGHMSLVPKQVLDKENPAIPTYYMPHHAVVRSESKTTKLRVVFDASAPSSTGLSLNSIQSVGPIVQEELFSIILRFRKHNVVMAADIAKMYRMVFINPEQRKLQRIVWRESIDDEIQVYELSTVTYGQASSSYLATRCLVEIANDCEETYPHVSEVLKSDFYVDDMLTGAASVEQAKELANDVSGILEQYGFILRKWQSNHADVAVSAGDKNVEHSVIRFEDDKTTKILGLTWSASDDKLLYAINEEQMCSLNTKRSILSSIAKIFDPLGLLAPCVSLAKIVMQGLWVEKCDWDEVAPEYTTRIWERYKSELHYLRDLSIPRQVVCDSKSRMTLIGFADASEKAYGACIYVLSEIGDHKYTRLLCAKSKLAPIKKLTTPRLELLAALLLVKLCDKVLKAFRVSFKNVFLWSDSNIVLAWIKTAPNLLKMFVANRVTEIQTLSKGHYWGHVSTHENPADHVSRGLYPSEIVNCKLWWEGPEWLLDDAKNWPSSAPPVKDLPELKLQVNVVTLKPTLDFPHKKFSNFNRLNRTLAWILRFKNNSKLPISKRLLGPLTNNEKTNALKLLVRIAQQESFLTELKVLRTNGAIESNNRLISLSPFLDESGIIRVGGRLKNSPYTIDKKHPMLLHADHHITKLLFEYEHRRNMHLGPQALLAIIRETFWVIKGRDLARKVSQRCLDCVRFKPVTAKPIMGNLPLDRVVPSSPFTVSGVDFAGPYWIKERKGRCSKQSKCYVCLFICFSTKAIHIEVVSSLSTNDFILALRRFVSRRGKPKKMYSDNGKNFVGASKELSKYLVSTRTELVEAASNEGIDWHFLPPYSPHFGGLWEAGVRSVKHHLKRVLTDLRLTFEEFTTLLAQIEAILNSRPLCPLSSDPHDFSVLTPAHFLIGRPLIAVADEPLSEVQLNHLNRYQLVQRTIQHFWKRWTREFLSELQQRHKWKTTRRNLNQGDLVLIIDDGAVPTEWRRGRINRLILGKDGVPRVAEIQTSNGVVQRNFTKICILPVDPVPAVSSQ